MRNGVAAKRFSSAACFSRASFCCRASSPETGSVVARYRMDSSRTNGKLVECHNVFRKPAEIILPECFRILFEHNFVILFRFAFMVRHNRADEMPYHVLPGKFRIKNEFAAQGRVEMGEIAGIHGAFGVIVPILRLQRIQRICLVPAMHLLSGIAEMTVDLRQPDEILLAVGIEPDVFVQKLFRFLPVLFRKRLPRFRAQMAPAHCLDPEIPQETDTCEQNDRYQDNNENEFGLFHFSPGVMLSGCSSRCLVE